MATVGSKSTVTADEEVIHEYMRLINVDGEGAAEAYFVQRPAAQRERIARDIKFLVAMRESHCRASGTIEEKSVPHP